MRTVHVESELPTDAERVWKSMQHPATMCYVLSPLVGIPALAGRAEPFQQGESGRAWLLLFHVIPLHRHHIELVEVDGKTRTMRSREHGGIVREWQHTLHAEPIGENRCRYSDTVQIDAGPFTAAVARLATALFRYRHRRWRKLVNRHLLPGGPSYAARG